MKFFIATFILLGFLQVSSAEETITEKTQATTNTTKRKMTKVLQQNPMFSQRS